MKEQGNVRLPILRIRGCRAAHLERIVHAQGARVPSPTTATDAMMPSRKSITFPPAGTLTMRKSVKSTDIPATRDATINLRFGFEGRAKRNQRQWAERPLGANDRNENYPQTAGASAAPIGVQGDSGADMAASVAGHLREMAERCAHAKRWQCETAAAVSNSAMSTVVLESPSLRATRYSEGVRVIRSIPPKDASAVPHKSVASNCRGSFFRHQR